MKNSGIEWIEGLPETWQEIPNRYLFIDHSAKVGEQWKDYQLLSLTTSGVKEKNVNAGGGKVPDSYENYQKVEIGDMIFCLFDLDCSAVFSGLSNYNGMITSAYDVFMPNSKYLNNLYADYWFQYVFSNRYYKMYSKNIRYTVTTEMFKSILTPIPPLDEQREIGEFLLEKDKQIAELIANQQAQIEKLKEYKQSVITEAVTKGLDKSAPKKDSGIEWIGKINLEHSVWKLKYLLQSPMMYGANESGEMYSENSVRYIRITDITMDSQLKDTEENLYLSTEKAQPYLLKDEDVLFARSGGTVGKSFIYKSEYGLSAFAGYLIKAECDKEKLLPEYLFFYTQSSLYELWKNMIFIQATIQNIGANKYSNMEIIIPSIEGQHKILNYLKGKCGQIDRLIAIKQEKIEKLQEYKKSLIYEYVTGKKEAV